jgi:micrococcal nuclease
MPRHWPWRFRRRRVGLAVVLGLAAWLAAECGSKAVRREAPRQDRVYAIAEVVDGDTLVIEGGHRVRLIGVDTPEEHASPKLERDAARSNLPEQTIQEMGQQATAFVRQRCRDRAARLEFDPRNASREHRDAYGRYLAYVFLVAPPESGQPEALLNAEILRSGYGRCMDFAHTRQAEFRAIEKQARQSRTGLWAQRPIP